MFSLLLRTSLCVCTAPTKFWYSAARPSAPSARSDSSSRPRFSREGSKATTLQPRAAAGSA